jgi:hypothetical protein
VVAWLMNRSPNILMSPGKPSLVHLRDNHSACQLRLSRPVMAEPDGIATAVIATTHASRQAEEAIPRSAGGHQAAKAVHDGLRSLPVHGCS